MRTCLPVDVWGISPRATESKKWDADASIERCTVQEQIPDLRTYVESRIQDGMSEEPSRRVFRLIQGNDRVPTASEARLVSGLIGMAAGSVATAKTACGA